MHIQSNWHKNFSRTILKDSKRHQKLDLLVQLVLETIIWRFTNSWWYLSLILIFWIFTFFLTFLVKIHIQTFWFLNQFFTQRLWINNIIDNIVLNFQKIAIFTCFSGHKPFLNNKGSGHFTKQLHFTRRCCINKRWLSKTVSISQNSYLLQNVTMHTITFGLRNFTFQNNKHIIPRVILIVNNLLGFKKYNCCILINLFSLT